LAPEVLQNNAPPLVVQVQRVRKMAVFPNVIDEIHESHPGRIGECLYATEEGRQVGDSADALRQQKCHDHDNIDVLRLEESQQIRQHLGIALRDLQSEGFPRVDLLDDLSADLAAINAASALPKGPDERRDRPVVAGNGFELDKTIPRRYGWDYVMAITTAFPLRPAGVWRAASHKARVSLISAGIDTRI
jgi:hypothetical protein